MARCLFPTNRSVCSQAHTRSAQSSRSSIPPVTTSIRRRLGRPRRILAATGASEWRRCFSPRRCALAGVRRRADAGCHRAHGREDPASLPSPATQGVLIEDSDGASRHLDHLLLFTRPKEPVGGRASATGELCDHLLRQGDRELGFPVGPYEAASSANTRHRRCSAGTYMRSTTCFASRRTSLASASMMMAWIPAWAIRSSSSLDLESASVSAQSSAMAVAFRGAVVTTASSPKNSPGLTIRTVAMSPGV